jgi:hypothetical protein
MYVVSYTVKEDIRLFNRKVFEQLRNIFKRESHTVSDDFSLYELYKDSILSLRSIMYSGLSFTMVGNSTSSINDPR